MDDELTKKVAFALMLEMGIVPIESPTKDVRTALESLTPEEARKAKRKFRKLWRKAAKWRTNSRAIAGGPGTDRRVGKGLKSPTRRQKVERKFIVMSDVVTELVEPLIEKMKKKDTTGDG